MVITAYDLAWASADRNPHVRAVLDHATGEGVTYAELLTRVDGLADGLRQLGVRPGDIVGCVVANTLRDIELILAVGRAGAACALLNVRLGIATISALVGRDRLPYVIVPPDPGLAKGLAEAAGTVAPFGRLLTYGGALPGVEELLPAGDARSDAPGDSPDLEQPAFVLYTSGTSGLPKGVLIPHRATVPRVVIMATQGNLRFSVDNQTAGVLPLSHAMGIFGSLLPALAYNGCYHCVSPWRPHEVVELIARERITALLATPTHFFDLLNADNCSRERLASLEMVSHTGAPMPAALLQRLAGVVDAPIGQLYGSTEMMNVLYADRQTDVPQVMRAGFYSRVRVVGIGGGVGDEVAPGQIGELLAAMDSPSAFLGYLGMPDKTAERIQDGWCRTGDTVVEVSPGEFKLVGRADDMIISGGENIYLQEVEDVLLTFPGVKDAVIVAVPHERWGQTLAACIEPDGSVELSEEALDRHCIDSDLPNFKRPRHYVFVPALPRNAMNKLLRGDVESLVRKHLGIAEGAE